MLLSDVAPLGCVEVEEPRALFRMMFWGTSGLLWPCCWLCSHVPSDTSPGSVVLVLSYPGFHDPQNGKQQILYVASSPLWFSCHLPILVDVNKLVDLDLLCLDRKIYF